MGPLRVCVEFVPGAHPPRGLLSSPGQPDRPFSGWTELFAVLQRLGCEIRSGKGSEIAIYRPGARIWTLTHHKRNPRVGWATVRRMLERLQIPMETWLAAVR